VGHLNGQLKRRIAAMSETPNIIGTCINCIAPGSLVATFAIIAVGIGLAIQAERREQVLAKTPATRKRSEKA
jgi:hypothetical protein